MGILAQYKGLSRANYVLFIGRLVTRLGAMIMPMLTLILNQKFGFSGAETAFWVIVTGIISLPANLVGGHLADRISKRKLIIICDIVSIVLYLYSAFSELSFGIFILLIIASFAQTMEGPAYQALVVAVTPEGKKDKAFSLMYMASNIGLMLAPTISGLLFNNYLWLCFIIDAVTIGLSTILIYLFIEESDATTIRTVEDTKVEQSLEKSAGTLILENKLILLFLITFVLYEAGYAQFSYLMPLDLTRLHGQWGATLYGTITSVNCITVVILNPFLTKILENRSHEMKLMAGVIFQILGFVVFLCSLGYVPGYYIAIILFTLGEIATCLSHSPFFAAHIPEEYHGRIFGISSFWDAMAGGVVMYVSGILFDHNLNELAWIFTIIVTVMALIMGIIVNIYRLRHK
ncbi:MAG: MFS transporter [Pseudobutyrivibrio sp.]|nr:MFS transporter [Pseudobutyrivibrio sp.]